VFDGFVNSALGSGMALLAYLLWPTWERGRARAALADMLSAYAGYLGTLAAPAPSALRREARTAARAARSNAQASLDRLRSEPATAPELVDLAVALFANGNRLARTAMALEAVLGDDDRFPCADAVAGYVDTVERALQVLATALRDATEPPPLPDLRGLQRALATQLGGAPERHAAETLVAVSDRLADNIDTLAHVLSRRRTVHAGAAGA
jgi:uncharacterized membrane protein YccC